MTVAVEIEQTAMTGHHHSMKEIQYLAVAGAQQYETTRVTVTNLDDGEYFLIFQNPGDFKFVASSEINARATAS